MVVLLWRFDISARVGKPGTGSIYPRTPTIVELITCRIPLTAYTNRNYKIYDGISLSKVWRT